jgi:hypothetical protein
MGGVPATRLTTTAPNGQSFTSSSQAARQTAQGSDYYGNTQAMPTPGQAYGSPQTLSEQQSVLDTIRQSLQPGAVTPPEQQPQPYVVGPRIQSQPQSYGVPAQSGYPQPQPQQNAPQPGREPARRRR